MQAGSTARPPTSWRKRTSGCPGLRRWRGVWCVLTLLCSVAPARADNSTPTRDDRVERLIAQMTLDEKLGLLEGQLEPDAPGKQYQAGYIAGIPRLGIPPLKLADGPPGVATRQPSTGMTCTMGVAATFSLDDARSNGIVIGRDAKALGQDVVLEPFVNLDRDPAWGRGFNTFGEDPLLTGMIGAAEIQGIQSQGVMAQVKHFIAFEGANNVIVDDQTLHEVYLQPFALAVEAGVASIMCAYNAINGVQACGSSALLTQVLRNELGFEGFVTSDWGANHATTYLNAGLELEMPGGAPAAGLDMPSYFAAPALRGALNAGSLTTTRVDEAVRRVLTQYQRFGLLAGGSHHGLTEQDRAGDAAVVLKTAEHAATLLKNQDRALPLSQRALSSLALIGPGAAQTIATNGGGEKPGGIVARQIGALQVLQRRLRGNPDAHVSFSVGDDLAGQPIPAEAFSHGDQPGLTRLDRTSGRSLIDRQIAFAASSGNALPAGSNFTWSGTLTLALTGDYWLNIQALGGTAALIVDGVTLNTVGSGLTEAARYGVVHPSDGNAPLPTPDGLANSRSWLQLKKGPHALSVVATPDYSQAPLQVRLSWSTPETRRADRAAALEAARHADTAVVFAWSGNDLSRPLPAAQDALIAEIAQVNPRTIVVLNTSQPVAMPWLGKVKAVLQMWFPGDEGGSATADVLLGAIDPSGHLPFTWPRAIDQLAAHQRQHPERASVGVGGNGSCAAFGGKTAYDCGLTRYTEGVQVGYRFFAAQHESPLFPFGFGLSYSSFAYSDLQVINEPDGSLRVSFAVKNTGAIAGDAVPQLYLGPPNPAPASVQFAALSLVAFTRVQLAPGQTQTLTVHVPLRQLQYWSLTQGWTKATGTRALRVNTDAQQVALQTSITIAP
jgi:beta-glucosidase